MIRLLIADDEKLEREALAELVQRRFEREVVLEMAENGRKAADTAVLWNADLILMDIEMPGMSGLDAARAVLAQRAVVYLGFADGAHVMRGQQAPAAQALQCVAAGVGQRDLAAVRRGRGQRAVALLLDHRGGEPGLRQGDGQRQARRACADDEDVAVVGGHGGRNAG